jgi:hypothetical protein
VVNEAFYFGGLAMRKGMWLVTLVVAGILGQASAVVMDVNPSPFRGGENTTLQAWDFLTNADPSAPDAGWNNPYGTPYADLIGDFSTNTVYLAQDYGHDGVWIVDRAQESDMIFGVFNSQQPNPYKEIWIQLVYSAQDGMAPMLYVQPGGTTGYEAMDMVGSTKIDAMYSYAQYHVILKPNPAFEVIRIRPRDCQVFVDSILIETQCIPEPVTMVLLGLGGLMLRKRIAA